MTNTLQKEKLMLADILHGVAEMEYQEREPTSYYPRPSSAGPKRCIRQTVYWANGTPRDEELPGRTLHVFDDGTWHEELTANWIAKSAYTLHSVQMEVEVPKEDFGIRLSGKIDGCISGPGGINDMHYEHKGLSHFGFQRYLGGQELPEDYLTQCAIYMRGLQRVSVDIQEGLLLIKNKNTSQFLEYRYGYDHDTDCLTVKGLVSSLGDVIVMNEKRERIVGQACEKFKAIAGYVQSRTLPDRPYTLGTDWQCDYCGWTETCWKGYKQELLALDGAGTLPEEYVGKCADIRSLGEQIKELEKKKKEKSADLLAVMHDQGFGEAVAGDFKVKVAHRKSNRIDFEAMPPSLREDVENFRDESVSSFVTVASLTKKG